MRPKDNGDLAIDAAQIAEFDTVDVCLDVKVDPEAGPKNDAKIRKH